MEGVKQWMNAPFDNVWLYYRFVNGGASHSYAPNLVASLLVLIFFVVVLVLAEPLQATYNEVGSDLRELFEVAKINIVAEAKAHKARAVIGEVGTGASRGGKLRDFRSTCGGQVLDRGCVGFGRQSLSERSESGNEAKRVPRREHFERMWSTARKRDVTGQDGVRKEQRWDGQACGTRLLNRQMED
ncbi:uncharacterized protein BJX67DRAFT_349425 [Aspergillus lucknowensis]|uniref:Uncharacterized protein n=1 Tax=Aspergillus lucknowensis TaxID=176173 RepID=A0ABR4LWG8_9EURO